MKENMTLEATVNNIIANGAIIQEPLVGQEAIDYAEEHNLLLNKHEDPTEGARSGLTIPEAMEIAREDPGLVWCVIRGQKPPVVPVNLKDAVQHAWPQTAGEVIRFRYEDQSTRGGGNRAARRAGRIVEEMVRAKSFGPQFHKLVVESRGL